MRRLMTLITLPAKIAALTSGFLLAAFVLAGGALLVAPPALADDPQQLTSQVTDSAGVLDDSAVRSEVAALKSGTGLRLYVVFVNSFDGTSGADWAEQTAKDSGFATGQIVLAVATDDRKYGYSGRSENLTGDEIGARFTDDVIPHLKSEDWDAAVKAAADTLSSGASSGTGVGTEGGMGTGGVVAIVLVLLVVGAAVIALVVRSRRRRDTGGRPQEAPLVPIADLVAQADAALVRTDDAVASSAQELSFARAEFGDEATTGFTSALTSAQTELAAAFAARRRVDDPRDSRAALEEVLARTRTADAALAEQAGAFAQLRDVEHRLPAVLADLTARRETLEQRAPGEQWRLEKLAVTWSPAALRPVTGNVEQAQRLLTLATGQIEDAQQRAAAGTTGEAAVVAHAVEGSLTQAATLLDAVAQRERDLAAAASSLAEATAETDTDLAQAQGLLAAGHHDPALAGLVARAQAARNAAAEAASVTGGVDPITALRSLQDADAALDAALDAVREQGQRAGRASASLAQVLPATRAEVSATRSYLSTRRGAVGAQARATLAQAEQLLDDAERTAQADPVAALASAQRADALAEQARAEADDDVDGWGGQGGPGGFGGFGGRGRGGWGPGGYGGRGWGGGGYGGGGGFEGAVLGGVLGGILGGGLGGSSGGGSSGGGGFGGGGFGGDSGGGSFGGGGGGSDSGGGSF